MDNNDIERDTTPTSEEEDEDFTAELDEPAGQLYVTTRSGKGHEEGETKIDPISSERKMKALAFLNDMLEESYQPVDPIKRKAELGTNWKDIMVPEKKKKMDSATDGKETDQHQNTIKPNENITKNEEETKKLDNDKEEEEDRKMEIRRLAAEVLANNKTVVTTKKVKFAGQEIIVENDSKPAEVSTLDTLLSNISEKKSISTIEKTSYDWEKYKKTSGDKDEVEKSKLNGFIEKQEFLNRVDQRRYEKERVEKEKERYKRELQTMKNKN
ncbi:hypothetical protein WA158_001828 [Blastocystis sp. Blastoise]